MKINRIFGIFTNRALMAMGMAFSWLLYALLFVYTDKEPIIPINLGYALGLCFIISIGVFVSFLIITSLGIWETVFTTFLWLFTSIILTVYICLVDRFAVINGLHEPSDYVEFILLISFFQMVLAVVFGYLFYPFAIKYKKNTTNYREI